MRICNNILYVKQASIFYSYIMDGCSDFIADAFKTATTINSLAIIEI